MTMTMCHHSDTVMFARPKQDSHILLMSSMSKDISGLVPYVDLITRPGHRIRCARRNRSLSPVIETLDISPHKRRKLLKDDSLGEKLSSKVAFERQVSPTASEYNFDSTHSQTASYVQELDKTFSSDNPESSSTPKDVYMSSSGLVPYVDLITQPRQRNRRARRNRSSSPVIETPDISPHERRKLQKDDSPGEKLSSKLIQMALERQVSPTASEYIFDSTHSQTASGSDTYAQDSDKGFSSDNAGSSSTPKDGNPLYEALNDEFIEDKDLFVEGETPVNEDEGDIPVRILQDFSIYNMKTFELVSVAELLNLQFSRSTFGSSGMVRPWIDEFDDGSNESDRSSNSPEDDGDYVRLSKILELNIHDFSDDGKELDSKIYIRTQFAWYILGIPNASYAPFYTPFWTQHRILHILVAMSLENKRTTYKDFVDNLKEMDNLNKSMTTARLLLGRDLRKFDIETDDVKAYILATLPELCAQNGIQISRVPVIREIIGPVHYDFDDDVKAPSRVCRKKKLTRDQEIEILKHSSNTFLTPIVNRIAQRFFEGSLEVSAQLLDDLDETSANLRDYKGHPLNPRRLVLSNRLVKGKDVFGNVTIDGVAYKAGDIVMVEPDLNYKLGGKASASQTVNKYGNRWWFCQIRYFFQKSDGNDVLTMFHGQWFSHGCKTILQETSHSKALYFLDTCDDNDISAIFKKCNVKILKPGDEEQVDDACRDANDFHCGLMYDDEHVSFSDLPPDALTVFDYKSCHSCDSRATEVRLEEDVQTDIGVVHHGVHYHVYDFVFILPTGQSKLLNIGQITKFKGKLPNMEIHIRHLGRYDDYVMQQKKGSEDLELTLDERRLFYRLGTSTISIDRLDGICYVQHLTDENQIEAWVKHNNYFFLNQEGDEEELLMTSRHDFSFCEQCHKDARKVIHNTNQFLRENSKLTGMELFSGAGGLGIGMDLSGFVETKYAIEFSPSAAETYKHNHPETLVYCQDSSALLKQAVAQFNNEHPAPLLSNDRKNFCPNMPDKNSSIDFIFGGPPCQSFSRANRNKRRNDIRSTLPCNMLSYVEHYEPDYFLLENVPGLLDHRLQDRQTTNAGVAEDCEIQSGMVKFILRTVIALGYQVHYKLLQAAQYGVPQSRNRVIFWGAKRGVPLPQFPVPMYAFQAGALRCTLPTGGKLPPPTRSKAGDFHQFAPLRPISVNDAIGDLPPFDWKNPHLVLSAETKDRVEAKKRQELGILQADAVFGPSSSRTNNPGYPQGAPYATPPQNRYLKWLRQGMNEDELVTGHYTRRFAANTIETTVSVPLKPSADHRDLPTVLLPNYARPGLRKPGITFFGRMDGDKHFRCALTKVAPGLKSTWPLHPWQKRIISVRECARAQGFPDSYVFKSINTDPSKIVQDQNRQIGNAVAVPFALALGKELGKSMIERWEKKRREDSVAL